MKQYLLLLMVLMGLSIGGYFVWYKHTRVKSGIVIILNGPSSVGKTSIIKAFQAKQSTPWLSIGIDNFFIGVLPAKFYLEDKPEHHSVMRGISSEDTDGKLFTLNVGPEGQKVIKGMHRAIAAYARAGNNVIVDYIKYEHAWIADLKESVSGISVIWVGVNAPFEVVQAREKTRGTSPEGHARSHYHTVHHGMNYDLKLDTAVLSSQECAEKIKAFMDGA